MKKFWMISMLLIAALFVISCGEGEEEGGEGAACTTQGAFRCSGNFSQTCDQEAWKNFEQCTDDKPCNATSGKCEAKSNNNTDPTTNPTDPTTNPTTDPTTEPTTAPDQSAMEACAAIYQCFAQCQDNDCANACVQNGDPAGQQVFMTMYNCWSNNCANASTNEEFTDCVIANCNAETEACGLRVAPVDGDSSYKSPYGSLNINFSVDQIANDSDGQQSTVGITQAAFATGTYGNGSTSVTPADAYMIQSMASYSVDAQYGNSVGVQQIPVYNNNGQGVGGNPVVIFVVDEENAAVGALNTSLYQGAQAMLYVVDVNWNSGQISCFHAFGEGTVNITNIGDIANHGALSMNGSVTLHSPKNYDGNGDISSQLGVTVCNPVQ